MKAIMMSIRPKYVSMILNKTKTIEIRKRFPKDYAGWVYIYNTKDKDFLCRIDNEWNTIRVIRGAKFKSAFAGKVIARFWCDKVEEIKFINPNRTCGFSCEISDDDCYYNINEKECCLSQDELFDYLQGNKGYAIHITKLEIFDKLKEISEFKSVKTWCPKLFPHTTTKKLTRAPQSWCYVEV